MPILALLFTLLFSLSPLVSFAEKNIKPEDLFLPTAPPEPQAGNPTLALAIIAFGAFSLCVLILKRTKKKICPSCEQTSYGQERGSGWITFILLLFFIVPGIIYAIWRNAGGRVVCPSCKNIGLVPLNSPVGKKIAGQF